MSFPMMSRLRLAVIGAGLLLALAAALVAASSGAERLAPRGPWSVGGSDYRGYGEVHTNPWSISGS